MKDAHKAIPMDALLSLLTAIVFFGSIPIFLKHFSASLDAWTDNGVRYGFAAFFWLPFVIRNHRNIPTGRRIWRDAARPACVNILGQTGWALSAYYNSAGMMGFVARSSFLFTIVFGFWLLHEERPLARRPVFWLGVVGTIMGLVALYGGGVEVGGTSPIGLTILLGTAASWGLYGVFIRRHMAGYTARLSFGIISFYTTVGLWILMFLFGDWRALSRVEPGNWLLLLISAVVGIALGHVLLYRAIHALGPVATEGGFLLIPFVTTLGAFLFLGESMGTMEWIGGFVLVLGSFSLLLAKRRTLMDAVAGAPGGACPMQGSPERS